MSIEPVAVKPSLLPPPGPDGRLRILPLSDLHLPKTSAARILGNRQYLDRMDYVVLLGDMVSCYGTDKEYEAVRAFVTALDQPYTAISGNHEWYFQLFNEDDSLFGQVWSMAGLDEQRAQLDKFLNFYRLDSLWRGFENELGFFLFLSLDQVKGRNVQTGSDAAHFASPSPGQSEAFSPEQLNYLEIQLRRAGERPLFIFCHAPLMLEKRLDMVYYDEQRTGCVEPQGNLLELLLKREAPTFWISGHVHLRPDHYLSRPYRAAGNVWQVHMPDSWGYGRWLREQWIPERYEGVFSKNLIIDTKGVTFVAHDHLLRQDIGEQRVDY